MNDPGAGDKPVERGTAPASTVVVRWWRETSRSGNGDRGCSDGTTRGTVRDLDGHTLGVFGEFDALVALLRRLVCDSRHPRG
ncbi:hypothetical protein U1701_11070 [Sphingomonas sp. PB2P19]|uniref:hypothetical protein n=1 Tax=Sphingomonas rhamnosi TaxID=3096156 RepID=UPI002FC5C4A3